MMNTHTAELNLNLVSLLSAFKDCLKSYRARRTNGYILSVQICGQLAVRRDVTR